jgi:hypothetical protein
MARRSSPRAPKVKSPVAQATAVWKLFHKKPKPHTVIDVRIPWPTRWEYAGEAVTTYYNSSKWNADEKFIKYFHDHERGKVSIWHPSGMFSWTAKKPQPPAFTPPASVAVLGFSLGVDVKRHDTGKQQHAGVEHGAYLVASPDRRRLWIVEPSKGITAMITGPGLRVNPEGICG